MADGIILGEQVYKKITSAWLEAAHVVFELDGDREALQEFRYAFGRNPAHIKKAVRRFPVFWNPDSEPDLFDLLATLQLSKIKDDDLAIELFEVWKSDSDLSYEDIKKIIADNIERKERGASLAERGADYVQKWRGSCAYVSDTLKDLESLEPIAHELARRAKAAK